MVNLIARTADTSSAKTSVGAMLAGIRRGHRSGAPSLRFFLAALVAVAVFLLAPVTRAGAAACPNESLRVGPSASLPDCMAYELVSPPRKAGQAALQPAIGLDGNRVFFLSAAALGETPGLESPADPYVASRGPGGWSSASAASPSQYLVPAPAASANSFDATFSSWDALTATQSQAPFGISQVFQGDFDGGWKLMSPLLVPVSGSPPNQRLLQLYARHGISTDLSTFLFSMGPGEGGKYDVGLLPGDPVPSGSGAERNLYEAHLSPLGEPSLALVARDRNGKVWGGNCGATVGAHAISGDGSRIYFATRPSQPPTGDCAKTTPLRILQRIETSSGPEISEPIEDECNRVSPPEEPCGSAADGDDLYQGASLEGNKVFFTTTRQLASGDLDTGSTCQTVPALSSAGCDLYLYDSILPAGHRLIQVSAGEADPQHPVAGAGAEVLGVTAISGDGSHVYFVAKGALTTAANSVGAQAQVGEPNLYVYERDADFPTGRLAFIGTLSSADASNLWRGVETPNDAMAVPTMGADPANLAVGGDGHVLVFGSQAPLTAGDTDGGMRDDFRYDSDTGELVRVTRAMAGGSDNGPFDVAIHSNGETYGGNSAQVNRWVSEDGNVIAFDSAENLTPGGDGAQHHFIWRSGALFRLAGAFGSRAGFDAAAVSQSGNEVAFVTYARLTPEDGDTAQDVYVARVDGGFPPSPVASVCEGEACQGPPTPGVPSSQAASTTVSGQGNAKPQKVRSCGKGKRRVKRHGKVQCVKKKKHHAKRRHHAKRAVHKSGGSK